MRLALALLLALAAPVAARADCDPNATQTELNQCYGALFDAADAELNGLYRAMTGRLGGDTATKDLLRAAQRAWIGWRDAECDFAASSVAGGSVYPMIRAGCLTEITRARSADFRRYLACEEGDLSCPLPSG